MSSRFFPLALIVSGAAAAALITACFARPDSSTDDDDLEGTSQNIEAVDPLEGAYIKQGGTALQFVFKKGDTKAEANTFFGVIDDNGTPARAAGTIVVARDNLGTNFVLTPKSSSTDEEATADTTTAPDGGAADEALVDQAFKGKVYYLKIGQNNSILVRKDATGKTAHYKKARSWCAKASDCYANVQHITDMTCDDDARSCNGSKCSCATSE